MKFDEEFKRAVLSLAPEVKDRLLLRLLKKDKVLVNQLYFELLCTESVTERREHVRLHIVGSVNKMIAGFYSPGYLLMDLKTISREITDHVKTTRDKPGEALLNLVMLIEVLRGGKEIMRAMRLNDFYTLGIYLISRTFKVLILAKALHADYWIEVEDDLRILGEYISEQPMLMRLATTNGLDVNWILENRVPDNIGDMYKDIRSKGLLR